MFKRAVLTLLAVLAAVPALASEDYDFWISEAALKAIHDNHSTVFGFEATFGGRSKVHKLGSDCEMHVATKPVTRMTAPEKWIIEPPYLCENAAPQGKWEDFFDANILNSAEPCLVEGFPRILDEHLHGEESPSNPHHAFELHPLTRITCGATVVDFVPFLGFSQGMSQIKDASAAKCFEMKVWVRRNTGQHRYEFQVDRPPNCGNFFAYEMSIFSEWIRSVDHLDAAKGHSALARVKPAGSSKNVTLKIYTLPGTAEDQQLATWQQDWENNQEEPHHGAYFHGLTTIDHFSVWKTVTNSQGQKLAVSDWKEVKFPLAMVVFGAVPDPDPNEDNGEDFHGEEDE